MFYGQRMRRVLHITKEGMALRLRSAPIWQESKCFAYVRTLTRASLRIEKFGEDRGLRDDRQGDRHRNAPLRLRRQ